MLTLDKIFLKQENDVIELSLEDWLKHSNLLVQSYQAVYNTEEDIEAGSIISLPSGMYNPKNDLIIINQEGFMLIPNYQYTESFGTITLNIPVKKNTNIHVIILKIHSKLN